MCLLDLSKVQIYEFHYDYIKDKYRNNSRIFFTGTDSLMYEIKSKDAFSKINKCLIFSK